MTQRSPAAESPPQTQDEQQEQEFKRHVEGAAIDPIVDPSPESPGALLGAPPPDHPPLTRESVGNARWTKMKTERLSKVSSPSLLTSRRNAPTGLLPTTCRPGGPMESPRISLDLIRRLRRLAGVADVSDPAVHPIPDSGHAEVNEGGTRKQR